MVRSTAFQGPEGVAVQHNGPLSSPTGWNQPVSRGLAAAMSYCDTHGDGPWGKVTSLYVTLVKDGTRLSKRQRVCSECLSAVSSIYGPQWSDGFVLRRFDRESACHGCGVVRGDNGTLHPLYATGFSRNNQRFDYYASYCSDCASRVIQSFDLRAGGSDAA